MRVFIANFGRENYEWSECLNRGTIATMNVVDLQPLWEKGDRETFIQRCMERKTAAGITPTKPVASRWFNLMTVIAESANDIWIHRAKDEFWWTISRPEKPTFEEKVEPINRSERAVVCHKPCNSWSDRNRKGNRLTWDGLHPKAKEFLFTEGTLQELSVDNARYAVALLNGDDLSEWHDNLVWKKKIVSRPGKGGPVTIFNGLQKAAYRMAAQAFATAATSNGQKIMTKVKDKNVVDFKSPVELEDYIKVLYQQQEGLCAITDLRMLLDDDDEDKEMWCSLDRIDSNRHYEQLNLQVVCRFVNRWKGSSEDQDFRRLVEKIRSVNSPLLEVTLPPTLSDNSSHVLDIDRDYVQFNTRQ